MLDNSRRFPSGLTWGLILMAVGSIFLLDQMGIVSAHHIFQFFWPAFLIFFGIEGLVFSSWPRQVLGFIPYACGRCAPIEQFWILSYPLEPLLAIGHHSLGALDSFALVRWWLVLGAQSGSGP